jgi:hypothetical protein
MKSLSIVMYCNEAYYAFQNSNPNLYSLKSIKLTTVVPSNTSGLIYAVQNSSSVYNISTSSTGLNDPQLFLKVTFPISKSYIDDFILINGTYGMIKFNGSYIGIFTYTYLKSN